MRERGSALLVAVISVMVLLLISSVFFSMINNQWKSNTYEERAIKSYYLAQAGIFYGVAKLKSGFEPELIDTSDGKRRSALELQDDPFEYGGHFTVQWEEYESGYKIYSVGSYGIDTGQVIRKLQAYYKTSTSGGSGGIEEDDIVEQNLLISGDTGLANTMFYFSNDDPKELSSSESVKLNKRIYVNEPLYLFVIHTSNNKYDEKRYASGVKLNLVNQNGDVVKQYFDNEIFTGVYDNHDSHGGPATSFMLDYDGNETVRLEVVGYIDNENKKSDETGTVTNWFNLSGTDDGLIWQIED